MPGDMSDQTLHVGDTQWKKDKMFSYLHIMALKAQKDSGTFKNSAQMGLFNHLLNHEVSTKK